MPFPDTLKLWRKKRRFSQLDLAVRANVSARHLAFLETGRSRPSPEMISRLGDALELPLSARNQLLTQAGFAARYERRRWEAEDMAPIRAAIDFMLERHAPWPGVAVDRRWTVVRLNGPARLLFGHLGVGEGTSLLEVMASGRLRPVVENWAEVAHAAAQRLRTESAAQGGIEELERTADVLAESLPPPAAAPRPVIPTTYRLGELRLSLFATIAQFGTPEDMTVDELKLELYFPADEASAGVLRALAGPAPGTA